MIYNQRMARTAHVLQVFTFGLGIGGGTASSVNYVSTSSGVLLSDLNGVLITLT